MRIEEKIFLKRQSNEMEKKTKTIQKSRLNNQNVEV